MKAPSSRAASSPRGRAGDGAAAGRPLIVRLPNYVGDAVLSLPALELLQAQGYQLQLVGKGWAGSLFAAYRWPTSTRPATLRQRVEQLRRLRREALAIDPEFDDRENMLVFPHAFSGALDAWLAGLQAVGTPSEARALLLARAEAAPWRHAVEQYWRLACRFLRVECPLPLRIVLATSAQDDERAETLLREQGVRPGFAVICPFAAGFFNHERKTWPDFPAFARALRERGDDVICCPGPGEAERAAEDFAGVLRIEGATLGVYGAILRRASVVVANDTGPAHIAAAVGAPVVSVLGPTVPEQWAPWGPTATVVRHWPRWPDVDEVMAAAASARR